MLQLASAKKAQYIIDNRSMLAEKAKEEGRTVMGFYCCLAVKELITAAGAYPFRIVGDVHENPTEVDRVLETTKIGRGHV